MSLELSKFAQNQFNSITIKNFSLMGEIINDAVPRATTVTSGIAAFASAVSDLDMQKGAWNGSYMAWNNAKAVQKGRTLAFTDKLASVTRKPDLETNSPLGEWEYIIEGQAAKGSPTYVTLLPNGRETITAGSFDEQLDALTGLSSRLATFTAKPVLVALGVTVGTFASDTRALRDLQTTAKGDVESARATLELRRKGCADALYALVGCAMQVWKETPERVDTVFDYSLLRNPVADVPDAPADTIWTPATRTLSITVMPARGSRLEAWRISPGGMPEQLHTGNPGETFVQIPTTITWISGGTYQLWLLAINGRGESEPGPVQSWTAP